MCCLNYLKIFARGVFSLSRPNVKQLNSCLSAYFALACAALTFSAVFMAVQLCIFYTSPVDGVSVKVLKGTVFVLSFFFFVTVRAL